MKIEFALNFAEFLEANQNRMGKASNAFTAGAVVAYLLVAFALLAFGLRTGFTHFEKGLPSVLAREFSSGFVVAGVLLLTGWPVLWQWRRKTDRRLSEEALRGEFDRTETKDDVRSFEANEQGLSYCSKHGSDSRPWEAFTGFWDGDSIATLTTKTNVYLLPKRAFTTDQFAELSSLADKVFQSGAARSLITTQLRPSPWDYLLGEGNAELKYCRSVDLIQSSSKSFELC